MKQIFNEIKFENETVTKSQFDIVNFEDILTRSPTDHSQFEFHKVSFYVVFIITEGSGTYNLNFKEYDFKKGTVFTIRKNNIHKFYKSKAKGILLLFTEDFVLHPSNNLKASKIILLFNEILSTPRLQLKGREFNELLMIVDFVRKEYTGLNDIHSPDIVRNFVQSILAKLFRTKAKEHGLLDDSKYVSTFLILQELVERDCFKSRKVIYYANKINTTSKTLSKITDTVIHKSAKTFINEIFIIRTKRLIINSQDSLNTIAYQVGFDEPSNFFKYFKKYTGISANQFREEHF